MCQLVRRIAAIRVVEICILSKFIIEFIRFGPSSTPSDFELANVKEKLCKIIRTLKSPENSIHLNIKKREKKNWTERHFWNSFLQTEKNKKRRKKSLSLKWQQWKSMENIYLCVFPVCQLNHPEQTYRKIRHKFIHWYNFWSICHTKITLLNIPSGSMFSLKSIRVILLRSMDKNWFKKRKRIRIGDEIQF